jgi:hypothetical protein
VAGGLLLGVAATGLIGSVGTRSQQPHPPSASGPAEGTPPAGGAPPIPTTAAPQGSVGAPAEGSARPPACAPRDLGVSVASDRTLYHPGDAVLMTSSVVDRSARACTVLARCAPPDVHATYRPSPGVHSIDWYESRQSRSCADGVSARVLQPGQPVVQHESAVAAMPKGGPGCGTAAVDLTAQVFLLGADQFVHAVQATAPFSVASPCPQATSRGPLG